MYLNEEKHHLPHIHIRYNEYKEVMDLERNILNGEIPYKQNQLVRAWILIHIEWEKVEDIAPENLYYDSIDVNEIQGIIKDLD